MCDVMLTSLIYKRLVAMKNEISGNLVSFAINAKQRFENKPFWHVENQCYIRVSSSGFRAVSISHQFPCKSVVDQTGKKLPERDSFVLAFEDAQCPVGSERKELGKNQPEHSLQAFILRKSLFDPAGIENLPELLGIKELADELHFVSDELKMADIRSDLIFVGKDANGYFPVLIELKCKRYAARLKEQLVDIHDFVTDYPDEFKNIFSYATGIDPRCIDLDRCIKLAVWPDLYRPESIERPEAGKLRGDRCYTVAYVEHLESSGNFTFRLQG